MEPAVDKWRRCAFHLELRVSNTTYTDGKPLPLNGSDRLLTCISTGLVYSKSFELEGIVSYNRLIHRLGDGIAALLHRGSSKSSSAEAVLSQYCRDCRFFTEINGHTIR